MIFIVSFDAHLDLERHQSDHDKRIINRHEISEFVIFGRFLRREKVS